MTCFRHKHTDRSSDGSTFEITRPLGALEGAMLSSGDWSSSDHMARSVTIPLCQVGRSESNDIVLPGDGSISRFHFRLRTNSDQCFIEDAGSRNGTYLNGEPVLIPAMIHTGDLVTAGLKKLLFVQRDGMPVLIDVTATVRSKSRGDGTPAIEVVTRITPSVDLKLKDTIAPTADGGYFLNNDMSLCFRPASAHAALTNSEKSLELTLPDHAVATLSVNGNESQQREKQLQKLHWKMEELNEQCLHNKIEMQRVRVNIDTLENLVALSRLLGLIGWTVEQFPWDLQEFSLSFAGEAVAVARVAGHDQHVECQDIAKLQAAQVRDWSERGIEPKGIIIAGNSADASSSMVDLHAHNVGDYAKAKNICILSFGQLIALCDDICTHTITPESVRNTLLSTNGQLLSG